MKYIISIFAFLLTSLSLTAFGQTDPDVVEFAFITDLHRYGPTGDVRQSAANVDSFVTYCNTHPKISFALFGGDFMNAYDTDHRQALWCLEHAQNDFKALHVPFYATRGNHDCNGKRWKGDIPDNSQIITNREYFKLFSPLSPSNPLTQRGSIHTDGYNPYGNYFYRDFPDQKFRLIVLNFYDCDSMEQKGYHGKQLKWLVEHALNFESKKDATEWCFLLVGHDIDFNLKESPISRLLHAYVRGERFADPGRGIHYEKDYHRLPRAKMVGFLGGHRHEDIYNNFDGYNIITVNRGFATGGEVDTEPYCFDHFILNTRTQTLEEHRIGRGRSRSFTYSDGVGGTQTEPQLAFPEAEGAGCYTVGGRNGRILKVTNLRDYGQGSLRWAVNQPGARTVVFEVSGNIHLNQPLTIDNDSISILGHTAPEPGICLTGAPIKINASEVIMRYLRIRPAERNEHVRVDAISDGDFGQHNIVLDHLSVSWSSGASIAICKAEQVTVQHCIQSQSIAPAEEDAESPSAGLIAGGFRNTFYHNLIANHKNAILFPNQEGQNRWIHLVRNVVYNWQDHCMYGGGRQGEITIEDNYFVPGPAKPDVNKILDVADDGSGRYYLSRNQLEGYKDRRNNLLVNDRPGMPYNPPTYDEGQRSRMSPVARPQFGTFAKSCISIAAFHYTPIPGSPTANTIWRDVLRTAGYSIVRDHYDNELIQAIRTQRPFGTSNGIITSAKQFVQPQRLASNKQQIAFNEATLVAFNRKVAPEKSIVLIYESEPNAQIQGYPYLAGFRDAISADSAYVGLLGLGDFLHGALIASISKGRYIVDLMHYAKYDAVNLGNEEFRYGTDYLKEVLNPIKESVVCSNLIDENTGSTLFNPMVIRQYGDTRIAFIGVTTRLAMSTLSAAFVDEDGIRRYESKEDRLDQMVQKYVDQARRSGVDYVILLSHLGSELSKTHLSTTELINRTTGIDVVIDSHTSGGNDGQFVSNRLGQPVVYARSAPDFQNIGKIVIAPDRLITNELISIRELQFQSPPVTNMIDSISGIFSDYSKLVIAHSDADLQMVDPVTKLSLRQGETNLGDLVTDAMRIQTGADLALINGAAIRADLPAGEIRREQLLKVLPFSDKIALVRMTGKQLHDLLNFVAKRLPDNNGHLLQTSGLRYTLQPGVSATQLEVLDSATGKYKPIEPKTTYQVAVSDFCLISEFYGGCFSAAEVVNDDITTYEEIVEAYIIETLKGKIGTRYSKTDSRIMQKN